MPQRPHPLVPRTVLPALLPAMLYVAVRLVLAATLAPTLRLSPPILQAPLRMRRKPCRGSPLPRPIQRTEMRLLPRVLSLQTTSLQRLQRPFTMVPLLIRYMPTLATRLLLLQCRLVLTRILCLPLQQRSLSLLPLVR
jgi:hypothetical protein